MPIVEKQVLPWLRLAHGLYNTAVIILVFYQARLGFVVRKARKANAPLPLAAVKRHRRLGPVLVWLGLAGFFAGLIIVTLGERNYLEHWHHLFTGISIAILFPVTGALSRRIKGPDPAFRNPHMAVGIIILVLYLLAAFLGVGILF